MKKSVHKGLTFDLNPKQKQPEFKKTEENSTHIKKSAKRKLTFDNETVLHSENNKKPKP